MINVFKPGQGISESIGHAMLPTDYQAYSVKKDVVTPTVWQMALMVRWPRRMLLSFIRDTSTCKGPFLLITI